MIHYIYLLKEREFIKTNEEIYKIGKTKQPNLARFSQYPNGSCLYMQIICEDCDKAERILINKFKIKFTHRNDIGHEYFEGDYVEMINIIYASIFGSEIHHPPMHDEHPPETTSSPAPCLMQGLCVDADACGEGQCASLDECVTGSPERTKSRTQSRNNSPKSKPPKQMVSKIDLNAPYVTQHFNYLYEFTKSFDITNNPANSITFGDISEWHTKHISEIMAGKDVGEKNYIDVFREEIFKYLVINKYKNVIQIGDKWYGISKKERRLLDADEYNFNRFKFVV